MKKKKTETMTKKERIEAAIHGAAADTIPYTLWISPEKEMTPPEHADFMESMLQMYNPDLLIAMHSDTYIKDFCGGRDFFSGPEPADGEEIKSPSMNQGAPAEEQKYLRCLLKKTKGKVPVVYVIFSPITTAARLFPSFKEYIKDGYGKEAKQVLETVTEATCAFVRRVIEMGADGIFFVAGEASYVIMEEKIYKEYGRPYDLAVLSASPGWCNILHVPGENIMFPLLRKYPAQIFSWHAGESLPTVEEAAVLTDGCLMTGPGRKELAGKNKNHIEYRLYEIMKQTKGRKIILFSECTGQEQNEKDILLFMSRAKKEIENKLLKEQW